MMQTIGQRLKAEREEQRLTLEKVFEATRIRIQYLQALEADDLSMMPSSVQARGYLRNYAEYLGLDVDQILNELRAGQAQPTPVQVIGPADDVPAMPPQEIEPLAPQPLTPVAEVSGIADDPPVPAEQLASSPSVTIPIKPKSTRRKKTDSPPQPASAEPPTRRRSRKKVDPEPEDPPIAEPQSILVEDSVPISETPVGSISQPESVEEPPILVEAAAEPVLTEEAHIQPGVSQSTESGTSLWQTWMSKIGSRLAARKKRVPPVQSEELEAPVTESEPAASVMEPSRSELSAENPPSENSSEIFKEIGHELRERRELLSLHLDEVEHNTHVKAYYLNALERGALDELPSTVQTRGMLSNYATFLDLDVDALLLRYADALQARYRERNPQKPMRKPGQPSVVNMPPIRSFIAGDMIFGVGMAILVVGFVIWGVSRVMTIQSQREIKPTAPSISDVLLASPAPSYSTPTPTFLPVEAFPGEATVTVEIPTQNANARVQLNLVAVERTYLRVIVDGKSAFDGRVVPGNAYPFEAENNIEVLVGSGAAIRIVYNGRDLGLMGTFGQMVHNIYTGTEITTPTALPTATPTITPTATNTVPPTATSRFTATPVPSATAVP